MAAAEPTRHPTPPRPLWASADETAAFRERLQAVTRRYRVASDAEYRDENSYHLSRLSTPEATRGRRLILEEYRTAYATWRAAYRDAEATLRRDLEQQGVAGDRVEALVDSYRRTTGASMVRSEKNGFAEDRYVPMMTELLDLVEANLGAWRIDEKGKWAFIDPKVQERYLEIARRMRAFAEESDRRTAAALTRAQQPNKAPEPTPGSVTPRAVEGQAK
jgi:hypothetical protein